jgi:hypothetical protein
MRLDCLSFAIALAAAGCADDLRNEVSPDAAPADDHLTHTDNPDGTTTTVVDATSETAWIYFDLQSRQEKAPMNPAASNNWDLGFQRVQITLNGGISGQGGMEVVALAGADFDAITEAPSAGYVTDEPDGDDEGEAPDLAFLTGDSLWYDYDPTNHVLTPRELVYCVRSVEGEYFKLRIRDYYANAGTSGHLELQWGPIAAPQD